MLIRALIPIAIAIVPALELCAGALPQAAIEVAQDPETLEDDVKAVFLYNFTKFVDWPAAAFRGESDAFRVCALADPPFVKTLETVLRGETARGRPLQLVRPGADEIPSCHILFIGRTETSRLPKVLPAATGRPVLTVSETPKFLEQGGAVNFVVENQRVRFDVDLSSVHRAGLTISSKLLRVARTVREPSQ